MQPHYPRRHQQLLTCLCWLFVASTVALHAQLDDPSACTASGVPNVNQYRTYIPVDGGFLPLYASFSLLQPAGVIEAVLVMNTGKGRDASTYMCQAYAAFRGQNNIGIIVPYFGSQQVSLGEWVGNATTIPPQALGSVYWPGFNWLQGGDGQPNNMSTFTALDILVDYVIKQFRYSGDQDQLRRIVVAGFSAGGQLVGRYAWATNYGLDAIQDRLGLQQLANAYHRYKWKPKPKQVPSLVTFVVSDPSTYLYLDHNRPAPNCIPLRDTGSSWTCTSFGVPDVTTTNCSDFDQYKLGLTGVGNYSSYFTRSSFDSSPVGLRLRSSAYLCKQVSFIVGGEDVCNCRVTGYTNDAHCLNHTRGCKPSFYDHCCDTYPDAVKTNSLDVECGAMLQGSNRLQRGLNYVGYLSQYGTQHRTVRASVVPGMGHDANNLYYSAAFRAAVLSF